MDKIKLFFGALPFNPCMILVIWLYLGPLKIYKKDEFGTVWCC